MASDDIISRLSSSDNSPFICSCCIESLKNTRGASYTAGHLTLSGFLEAVANKCFICWRLFETLDSTRQECFKTLVRHGHLKKSRLGSNDLCVTYLIHHGYYRSDRSFQFSCYFESSSFKTESWNFNPEKLPDLANAIEVMHQFYENTFPSMHPSFSYSLVVMNDDPETSGIIQWIKSCSGSVDATAWEETVELVREWLQACSSGHAQCAHRASDPTWFPTRVLDLEPAVSDGRTIKIVTRDQVAPGNRYVTLSHRWTPFIPKLTSHNLEAWSHQLPVDALTKTFRDFITVSRRLGFRYAWIDSLCIIQESHHGGSDWSQECLTMDLIYRNSFCNFSADWSTHSGGLFLDRGARQFDCPIVTANLPLTRDTKTRPSRCLLVDEDIWRQAVTMSPINSRGWVLQERFLSPRVLHFCPNEVFFECCAASRSERFRQPLPAINALIFGTFKNIGEHTPGNDNTAACHQLWNRLQTIYSRCTLTFASDKLVAISGIARYLKTFLVDDVYVMGVWASTVVAQMLWLCEGRKIRDDILSHHSLGELRPLPVSAVHTVSAPLRRRHGPTFSWVSADLPMDLPQTTGRYLCEGVRLVKYRQGQTPSDDESITEDIFDDVSGPLVELKVTGLLRRVRLIDAGHLSLYATIIDGTDHPRVDYSRNSRAVNGITESAYLDFIIEQSELSKIESQVFFCMAWGTDSNSYPGEGQLNFVLLELANREMGRFRRIGMMKRRAERAGPMLKHNDGDDRLPCGSYDTQKKQHTIYII